MLCTECKNIRFCANKRDYPKLNGCTSGIPYELPSERAVSIAKVLVTNARALDMSVDDYKELVYREVDSILKEKEDKNGV